MRDKKTLEMTLIGLFSAIIIAMAFIPQVGFFRYGGIAITTLHIPVIIGAIFGGAKFGIALGFTFGLFSFIVAITLPDPGNLIFQNPILAIAPRVIFGLSIWYVYQGLRRLFKKPEVHLPLTFLLTTLIHTGVTVAFIILFQASIREFFGAFYNVILIIFPLNGLVEIGLAILIGTPIVMRLRRSQAFEILKEE